MPPHIESSDEESVGEAIPFHNKEDEETKPIKDEEKDDQNGEEDEDDEDDEADEADEDVYVVERVVGHSFDKKGKLQFEVKWKGYDDPSDMTVEPEENLLDGAQDALEEYFKKIGGRPEKPTKKRKSLADKASSTPDKPTKRGRKPSSIKVGTPDQEASTEDSHWAPPTGDWENELRYISTVLRDPDGDGLVVYLEWKNGRKSRAPIQTCYERCPQMMLKFYEQHLVFKEV
ncbi:Heterochromatin protein HP1 [Trichophyton interdigitale]|uniref:Heterochromatin protein HP1 n=2 Tax=Trichophyton interdigitale TaxID=101480 RepID=A0A9P4YJ01_9EURO|nr:hypothetical protein H101_00740 [Trichophyton interdigitale H6]KAF3892770.1 Heterochromatin protein HP1 [Trichophyton interdigitale]KAF3899429.1 Heterochromatin protein HP1 [Trichophyton interdigitale]